MARKVIDCRDSPESNCSLRLSGEEDEVIRAAAEHSVSVHGEKDSEELRRMLKDQLKDDVEDRRAVA